MRVFLCLLFSCCLSGKAQTFAQIQYLALRPAFYAFFIFSISEKQYSNVNKLTDLNKRFWQDDFTARIQA
ncbi:hypothetical protein B9T26_12685 [Acinetobacter sp. ANC 4169]|nr:hypothetical protein B9T26_12685 [Acinetobacter sp. ANC 4169]